MGEFSNGDDLIPVDRQIRLVARRAGPIDDLSAAVMPVPEPSTIALLSVSGLVGMSVLLRRRQVAR